MPAKLIGLCEENGFGGLRAEAIPLIATSKAPDTFVGKLIEWTVTNARDTGAATTEEATAWATELDDLDQAKSFFFCLNRVLFTGVKSNHS